jgi:hypothetical protein
VIPPDAVYVFKCKEPCRAAEKIMIERMKLIHAGMFRTPNVTTKNHQIGGNWQSGEPSTSRLDKK